MFRTLYYSLSFCLLYAMLRPSSVEVRAYLLKPQVDKGSVELSEIRPADLADTDLDVRLTLVNASAATAGGGSGAEGEGSDGEDDEGGEGYLVGEGSADSEDEDGLNRYAMFCHDTCPS